MQTTSFCLPDQVVRAPDNLDDISRSPRVKVGASSSATLQGLWEQETPDVLKLVNAGK